MNDSLADWQRLADWLNEQVKLQHWTSLRSLARAAGISHATVAKMSNAQGPFEAKSLNAIADALGAERETVHRLAGLLPDYGEVMPEAKAWSARLNALSSDLRVLAVGAMEAALRAVEGAAQLPRR